MDTVKRGSKGTSVKILQAFLGIEIDGKSGKQTVDAIKKFQAEHNLKADGICGEKTWDCVYDELDTIKSGDKGNIVAVWQVILGVDPTGIFDEKLVEQTRAYQFTAGLNADGIVGELTWAHAFRINLSVLEPQLNNISVKPVDYKQYDSRWGKIKYSTHTSKQTIKNSGCGPTAMADIVATWWDKKVTPKEMAALSVKNGYRTYNSGTSWNFFKFVAQKYKAQKFVQTKTIATLKNALNEGAYAVVSFGPSKWTKNG